MEFELAEQTFLGAWEKDDHMRIEVTVEVTEDQRSYFVAWNGKRAPLHSFTASEFSIHWEHFGHSEWEIERFVLGQNPCQLVSKGKYIWQRPPAVATANIPAANVSAENSIRRSQTFLSLQQLKQFQRDGYVVIPQAAAPSLVTRARATILCHIGRHGIPPDKLPTFRAQSYVPELLASANAQPLRDVLLRSAAWCAAQNLIGALNPAASEGIQVAIRFPDMSTQRVPRLEGAHIDGIPTPQNGLTPGLVKSFTLLVGVALTQQDSRFTGNLTVYPGSHRRCSTAFQAQWDAQAKAGVLEARRQLGPGHSVDWPAGHVYPQGAIDGIEPQQVLLQRGDAVLCHYQLVHCVADNTGDEARMNLYWRLSPANHGLHSLVDLFADFDELPGPE